MTESASIRVRIAPSPTGYLHLGTIRSALFNYLFAKKEHGAFIVRVEDTDVERSLPIYESDILEGFKALGLVWDEGPDIGGSYGPYRQSERTEIYKEYLEKIIAQKKAYWCFCTKDELEEERKAMLSAGVFPKYSGKCRNLDSEEVAKRRSEGKEAVIRLNVPSNIEIDFSDLIRGKVSVNSDTIGDIVIARNEQSPLYNFAVVIDDYLMKISHVIRGEDHISNTPKQILIQRALGLDTPKYAHLPLVLNADRSKMSKRKMETSFDEYIKSGYLPEALVNFLVLLGWHPEDDQEILSLEEIINKFSIKRVQKAGAIFNVEKLDWFNAQYIKKLSAEKLAERIKPLIPESWTADNEKLVRAVSIEQERMEKLSEFADSAKFVFEMTAYDYELLKWKDGPIEVSLNNLKTIREAIEEIPEKDFDKVKLEEKLMPIASALGRGETLWPLRVALSGQKNSPGPFEIMWVIGKPETLSRIDKALELK